MTDPAWIDGFCALSPSHTHLGKPYTHEWHVPKVVTGSLLVYRSRQQEPHTKERPRKSHSKVQFKKKRGRTRVKEQKIHQPHTSTYYKSKEFESKESLQYLAILSFCLANIFLKAITCEIWCLTSAKGNIGDFHAFYYNSLCRYKNMLSLN